MSGRNIGGFEKLLIVTLDAEDRRFHGSSMGASRDLARDRSKKREGFTKMCRECAKRRCLIATIKILAVEVLAVTIFLSLLLAVFFVVLFLGSQRRTRHSMEQDALLPLDEGCPQIKPNKSGPR